MSSNGSSNDARSQFSSDESSILSFRSSIFGFKSSTPESAPSEVSQDNDGGSEKREFEGSNDLSRYDSHVEPKASSQPDSTEDAKQSLLQGQRQEQPVVDDEGDDAESSPDNYEEEDDSNHRNDREPVSCKICGVNCESWQPGFPPFGPRDYRGERYCRRKRYVDHRRRDGRVGIKKHIREYLRCVSPDDERPYCSSCLRGGAPDEQPPSSGQPDKKNVSKHEPAGYVGYIIGPYPEEWATSHTSGNAQAFDPRAPAFVPSNILSTAMLQSFSTDRGHTEQVKVESGRQEVGDDKYTIRQWIQDGMRQKLHRGKKYIILCKPPGLNTDVHLVKIESQSQSEAQARMRIVLDEWNQRQRRLGYLSESPELVIKREPVIKCQASLEPEVKREEMPWESPDPVIKEEGFTPDNIFMDEIPLAPIPFRGDLSDYSKQLRLKADLRRRDYWRTWTAYSSMMSEQCLEDFATRYGQPGWEALWAGQAKIAADHVELAGFQYAKAMLDDMEQVLVEQLAGRDVSL